jgi:hypothetical protein
VRRCASGRFRFHEFTVVTPDPGRTLTRFDNSDPYSYRQRGLRIRVHAHSVGRRHSIYRWSGSFAADATVRRHGRVLDRCHFARVRWSATAPRASLTMSSDPNDYILQGKSYSYATPADSISVTGNRHEVTAAVGPWFLTFKAPGGRKPLRERHYTGARRAPFAGGHPGIELDGDGRGCNEIKGEFTIKRIAVDRRGVRAFVGSFVQHCEGGDPAARGTLSYHR